VEIETATSPEDLAAVAAVLERVEGVRVAVDELAHDLAADPDTRFLLARLDGEVVGTAVGKRSSQRGALYAMARVLFRETGREIESVRTVTVKRAWRQRGIATALKRAQIAWAADKCFERLVTYNDEANAPMRGVNARLGYYVPQPPVVLVHGPPAPR